MHNLGKNIKSLREARCMTQDAFAEQLHVTRQTVSNYENGRSQPDLEMLAEIARVLDTDANTLLGAGSAPVRPDTPAVPEARKPAIRRLAVSSALLIALVLVGIPLREWASAEYQAFRSHPWMCMKLFFYPALWALGGWVFMQALEVFAGIRPLQKRWCRYAKWVVLAGMFLPYGLIFVPLPIPTDLWLSAWTFMKQPAWFALFGAALWLFGFLTGKQDPPTA